MIQVSCPGMDLRPPVTVSDEQVERSERAFQKARILIFACACVCVLGAWSTLKWTMSPPLRDMAVINFD